MQISLLEVSGAVLALAFILLASRRSVWAWPPYIASSLLYLPVFLREHLYLDSLLQLYFVGMGVYGWRSWAEASDGVVPISWTLQQHARWVALWLAVTLVSGTLLAFTPAGGFGFADAFIALGSIIATVITVRRVLENWWYWLAINLTSVVVYGMKGLWVSAGLFCIYAVLSVRGLIAWSKVARSKVARSQALKS